MEETREYYKGEMIQSPSLEKHAFTKKSTNMFAETVIDNMLWLLREKRGHLGSWKQKREDCHEHITR